MKGTSPRVAHFRKKEKTEQNIQGPEHPLIGQVWGYIALSLSSTTQYCLHADKSCKTMFCCIRSQVLTAFVVSLGGQRPNGKPCGACTACWSLQDCQCLDSKSKFVIQACIVTVLGNPFHKCLKTVPTISASRNKQHQVTRDMMTAM